MVEDSFKLFGSLDFRDFKSQTDAFPICQTSEVDNPLTCVPHHINGPCSLQEFGLSTRSTVLHPLSRSMVEISFESPDFGDFKSQPLLSK
jgi:hypothetical protein